MNRTLPRNGGHTADLKARHLDCLVINYLRKEISDVPYQTVLGVIGHAFWECFDRPCSQRIEYALS
jgi:hypothetical protein